MKILIEKATVKDASVLATLKINIWQNVYRGILPDEYLNSLSIEEKMKKYEKELMADSSVNIYFLKWREKIIGTLRIKHYQDKTLHTCICIEDLYLLPQYHSKGYGGFAMNFVIKQALSKNYYSITAWIIESNIKARRLALKLGFAETQTVRTHVSTGIILRQYYLQLKD